MTKALIAFAMVALAFSTRVDAKPAPSSGGSLAKVFTSDMLVARVAYFESKFGPAWQVNGDQRLYKLGGCEITAYATKGEIYGLGIEKLSPKCSFTLMAFLGNAHGLPPLHQMTFGQFDKGILGAAAFDAECLQSCGNASDPSIYEVYEGPHAENFINIRLSAVEVGDAVIDASSEWSKVMLARKGEDWLVFKEGFHCDKSFDPLAHRLFANVRVTGAVVSRLPVDPPKCP